MSVCNEPSTAVHVSSLAHASGAWDDHRSGRCFAQAACVATPTEASVGGSVGHGKAFKPVAAGAAAAAAQKPPAVLEVVLYSSRAARPDVDYEMTSRFGIAAVQKSHLVGALSAASTVCLLT